jgi:hypothetical protein
MVEDYATDYPPVLTPNQQASLKRIDAKLNDKPESNYILQKTGIIVPKPLMPRVS